MLLRWLSQKLQSRQPARFRLYLEMIEPITDCYEPNFGRLRHASMPTVYHMPSAV